MSKKRLSVTIDENLVKLLDRKVDGAKIRNRSHALEYILRESLNSQVKKVLILAGGKCIELASGEEIPKPLLSIHGRPLLEHTLMLLKKNGFTDLVISIGRKGEKIKDHFGDGSQFGVEISYVNQGEKPKGTGGAVKVAESTLPEEPFLVVYGDVLIDIDLTEFATFHKTQKKEATVALTSTGDTSLWGVADLKGSQVLEFSEKPEHKTQSHLINAGVYVFEPTIFSHLPDKDVFSLEEEVLPELANKEKLAGWVFYGPWFDVGSEKFRKAAKEWKGK